MIIIVTTIQMHDSKIPLNLKLCWEYFRDNYDFSYQQFVLFFEKYDTKAIHEFCWTDKNICKLWQSWHKKNKYNKFSVSWDFFKKEYKFASPESKEMFKQISFMSEELLNEWIYFSNDSKDIHSSWKGFVLIWELDFLNYNEYVYSFVKSYVKVSEDNYPLLKSTLNYNLKSMSDKFEACLQYKKSIIIN